MISFIRTNYKLFKRVYLVEYNDLLRWLWCEKTELCKERIEEWTEVPFLCKNKYFFDTKNYIQLLTHIADI